MLSPIERAATDILRREMIAAGVPDADQYEVRFALEPDPTPPPSDPGDSAGREAAMIRLAVGLDLPPELLDVPPGPPFF